jgi:hypothetical protein
VHNLTLEDIIINNAEAAMMIANTEGLIQDNVWINGVLQPEIPANAVSIVPGWNAISPTLWPPPGAKAILNEIALQGGDASAVYHWRSETDTWEGHVKSQPYNNFELELGRGYFLRAMEDSVWTNSGTPPNDPMPVDLNPIWTFMSLPKLPGPMMARDLLDEATAQGGQCTEIHRWRDGAWHGHSAATESPGFVLSNDEGYFVKCVNTITYVPGQGAVTQDGPSD